MLSKDVCLWCEADYERAVEPQMSECYHVILTYVSETQNSGLFTSMIRADDQSTLKSPPGL